MIKSINNDENIAKKKVFKSSEAFDVRSLYNKEKLHQKSKRSERSNKSISPIRPIGSNNDYKNFITENKLKLRKIKDKINESINRKISKSKSFIYENNALLKEKGENPILNNSNLINLENKVKDNTTNFINKINKRYF
jgi:hypothetical protein